ncbi:MAG: hypothetical protein WCW47_01700 [Candidatus Paceibacterota bacterium]|jgi:hypothetical protein
MFELLEKLRQKPDHVKKQIAFLATFFLVGVIFVVWLSVVYPSFKEDQSRQEAVSNLEPSPLETFKETLGTGISAMGENFNKLKESITLLSNNPAFYSTTTTPSIILSTTTESQN